MSSLSCNGLDTLLAVDKMRDTAENITVLQTMHVGGIHVRIDEEMNRMTFSHPEVSKKIYLFAFILFEKLFVDINHFPEATTIFVKP